MSKIFERTILKRRYTNDQQAREKLLSIFGRYGKLKPLHIPRKAKIRKTDNTKCW